MSSTRPLFQSIPALFTLSLLLAGLSGCNGTGSVSGLGTHSGSLLGDVTGDIGSTSGGDASGNTGTGTGGAVALDAEEAAFVTLINDYRAQNGLGSLQVSVTLTQASKWMSEDMAAKDYFDHSDSLGRSPFTRIADFGYTQSTYAAENIAAGNSTAQATFTQWKNSAGHNANMLGANYKVIGVGRAHGAGTYGWYWTTDFGSFVDQTL